MFKYRKRKKSRFLIILFAFVVSISLGYAYLERTLNINGSSYLAGNTWKIQFDNFVVTEGSVEPTSPVTFDDKKANINFGVDLNLPGEFYEFTVDIVNKGTLRAYVSDFVMTELTEEQAKFLKFSVSYLDGSSINISDYVELDCSLSIIVRIEYLRDSNEDELIPSTDQYIDLNISFNFSQDDGLPKQLLNRIKHKAKVDDFVNFGNVPSKYNGEGVMIKSDTKNEENPIYYYRGNVGNNNVRWANKCWKIIRTTDTGGVKMIYNGLPAADGSCNNSGTASTLSTYRFNTSNSPSGVGYMYGNSIGTSSRTFSYSYSLTSYDTFYYSIINGTVSGYLTMSSTVSYDDTTGMYTLVSPVASSPMRGYYTCGSSATTCSTVRYIYAVDSSGNYVNGNTYNYYVYAYLNNSNGNTVTSKTVYFCKSYCVSCTIGGVYYSGYYLSSCNNSLDSIVNDGDTSNYYYVCSNSIYNNQCSSVYKVWLTTSSYSGASLNTGYKYQSPDYYYFASSVEYADGMYTLVDPVSRKWSASYNELKDYPYSCFSTSSTGSCSSVYYIYDTTSDWGPMSYINFYNGEIMSDTYLNSMFENNYSSYIKSGIDSWYVSNLANYSNFIEDTSYCNDRTNSGLNSNSVFTFNSYNRYSSNQISLDCSTKDSFSTDIKNGNGLLSYPVGLITIDEAILAGANKTSSTYLNTGSSNVEYWTMTPYNQSRVFSVGNANYFNSFMPSDYMYLRPVISIKGDITILGGDGSSMYPYKL